MYKNKHLSEFDEEAIFEIANDNAADYDEISSFVDELIKDPDCCYGVRYETPDHVPPRSAEWYPGQNEDTPYHLWFGLMLRKFEDFPRNAEIQGTILLSGYSIESFVIQYYCEEAGLAYKKASAAFKKLAEEAMPYLPREYGGDMLMSKLNNITPENAQHKNVEGYNSIYLPATKPGAYIELGCKMPEEKYIHLHLPW